jgi:hypothetical protein
MGVKKRLATLHIMKGDGNNLDRMAEGSLPPWLRPSKPIPQPVSQPKQPKRPI